MKLSIDIPDELYNEYVIVNLGRGNGKGIVNDLLEAIKKGTPLPNQTDWIPVSERLPDNPGNDYLVTIEYKGEIEGVDVATYGLGGYIDGLWDTVNDWIEGPSELWHVTAWTPLPAPYKKEGDSNE